MTDVSNLDDLANAIASSSAKIKNYAKAQAAASQSQEVDIQSRAKASTVASIAADLEADLAALEARVAALEAPVPNPPDPNPPGTLIYDGGPTAAGAAAGGCPPWDGIHAQTQSGLTNSPRFQKVTMDGKAAWRCEVRQGDFAQWTNGREITFTQESVLAGVGLGSDTYTGWSIYVPTDYVPTNKNGDNYGNNFVEWHPTSPSGAQAAMHFGANGANGQFFVDLHIEPNWNWASLKTWDLGPIVKGRMVNFVARHKWRTDASGVFELWMDGVKKITYNGRTWGVQGAIYPQIGHYRSPDTRTVVLHYGHFKVGTTREIVES